jgi:hypothetical protein
MTAPVRFRTLVLAAGVSFVTSPARADWDEPRLAVVSDGTVNVVVRGGFGDLSLERADLASGRAQPATPVGEPPDFRRGLEHPPRWRIGHGYYWGVNLSGFRGGGFRGFRRFQPPTADLVRIPLAGLRPTDGPAGGDAADGPPTVVGLAEPLTSALILAWQERSGPVHFDLVPIGSHACRLFVIVDGELEVWDYRFRCDRRNVVEGHWKEVRRIPLDWNEPFLALSDGPDPDRLFLANSSGTLWEVPPTPDASPRAVWSDPARPIRWVVVDPHRGRSIALGRGFLLRVESRPSPVRVAPTLDPSDTLSAAVRAVRSVLPEP